MSKNIIKKTICPNCIIKKNCKCTKKFIYILNQNNGYSKFIFTLKNIGFLSCISLIIIFLYKIWNL